MTGTSITAGICTSSYPYYSCPINAKISCQNGDEFR